jgi:tetratricopeptide (TPR) repeat protein
LSLDAVEELATNYSDRVTKSHLSRIENGRAEPTFRRLFVLSQIYGEPMTRIAERFELDLRREQHGASARTRPLDPESGTLEVRERIREGRYLEALDSVEILLDAADATHGSVERVQLRLERVNCLMKLDRVELAKNEAEAVLDSDELEPRDRVRALYLLAACCIRTSRLTVGRLAIEQARQLVAELPEDDRLRADVHQMAGKLAHALGLDEKAMRHYADAVDGYVASGCRFEEARARRNLAAVLVVLGKLSAAKRKLLDLVRACEAERWERQLALALGDLGIVAYREDALDVAESYCLRSNAIAREREYLSLVFQNCFYLWRIAQRRADRHGEAVNLRTLRSYVSRVDQDMEERAEFLAAISEDAS